MPTYRTGNNLYAIQAHGYGGTGAAVNTTGFVNSPGYTALPNPFVLDGGRNVWHGAVEEPSAGTVLTPDAASLTLATFAPDVVVGGGGPLAAAAPFAVAHWDFDEASGNAVDTIGAIALAESGGTVGSGTGQFGGARDFEAGDTELLTVADNATLSAGDILFMVRVWIKPESLAANSYIVSKEDASGLEYYLSLRSSGAVRWGVASATGWANETQVETAPGVVTAGNLYLLHAWHDPVTNEISLSVNAATAITTAYSAGIYNGPSPFEVGGSTAAGAHYDGLIDDLVILKGHVLDATGRTADYAGGVGVAFANWAVTGGLVVTPDVAALTLTAFAPAVAVSDHKVATPATLAVSLVAFAPTVVVSNHKVETPPPLVLTTATFVPTVVVSDHKVETPPPASLTLAMFAPTVVVSDHKAVTPPAAALVTTAFAPATAVGTVLAPAPAALTVVAFDPVVSVGTVLMPPSVVVTVSASAPSVTVGTVLAPTNVSLVTAAFAPTVVASDHKVATPETLSLTLATSAPTVTVGAASAMTPPAASLTLATFAPTVVASDHITATPATLALTLTAFAPLVVASENVVAVPDAASLTLSTLAPAVMVSDNVVATPTVASLVMTAFAPTVTVSGHLTVTPSTLVLTLAGYAPTVQSVPPTSPFVTMAVTHRRPVPAVTHRRPVPAVTHYGPRASLGGGS